MPLTREREYNLPDIEAILAFGSVAFLERLWPMPVAKGGVKANWQRGNAMGTFRAILASLGIPCTLVAPQAWQNEMLPMRGGDTKARSIAKARELFPEVSLFATLRSRKPSDGCSDALLIAEFGRRKLEQEAKKTA